MARTRSGCGGQGGRRGGRGGQDRRRGGRGGNAIPQNVVPPVELNVNPEREATVAEQIAALMPDMISQIENTLRNNHNSGPQPENVVGPQPVPDQVNPPIVNLEETTGKDLRGCSYKEFKACGAEDYDGKGGAVKFVQWLEKMESVIYMSECKVNQRVKFVSGSFKSNALVWWNTQLQTRGTEPALDMPWDTFKSLMLREFCTSVEVQKLEHELWDLQMVEADHTRYTNRFHELARLVPHFVTPESRRIEKYVYGLEPRVRGTLTSHTLTSIQEAIERSAAVTEDLVRSGVLKRHGGKRKEIVEPSSSKKRGKVGMNYEMTVNDKAKDYTENFPLCTQCNQYHPCAFQCYSCFKCGRKGHRARECKGVLDQRHHKM